ncbi:MAG: phosphoribosyltransferase family protein [Bacteroidota bacterium]
MSSSNLILNEVQIKQRLNRIAYQIYEDSRNEEELIIAGISNSGYRFAVLLNETLKSICPIPTQLIEITLDKNQPTDYKLNPPCNISDFRNKTIIIVDDVLNSGKTLMYSLRPFLEGDVKKIRTALLVNRDHKRYPVEADFVGITLSTTLQEHIRVDLTTGKEAVYLE